MARVHAGWLTAAACGGMFACGIVMSLFGAVLPVVSERARFDLASAGNLFLVMNAAMLVTLLGVGAFMDRFGKRIPLAAGPLLVSAGLVVLAGAHSLGPVLACAVCLGLGGGCLNAACNLVVADLHEDETRKAAALNALGIFFGLGAMFLPLLLGGLLRALGIETLLLATAGLAALPAAPCFVLAFPPPKQKQGFPLLHAGRFLRDPLVIALGLLLFFQSGNEFSIGGFATSLLTRDLGVSVPAASWCLAAFWAALILVRVVLSRAGLPFSPAAVVGVSALAAAGGAAMLALAPNVWVALAGMLLIGAGFASVFPNVLAMAASRYESHSGTVFGLLFAMALSGGMSLPWLLGRTAASAGLRPALGLGIMNALMVFAMLTLAARRLRAVAVAAAFALAIATPARAQQDFLPMSVWYGGGKARAPMLEPDARARKETWRRDVRQIKALGFNTVRCWMDWATGEPDEGKYNLETLDVLLELAQEEGLKLMLQVYMDAAPDWVGRKFPDSHYVAASGDVMPSEASPGFCRDHPGVRSAELAFLNAMAERARKSPAFFGWDLWSEPHVINWANATYLYRPEFCFCPSSVRRYRAWLQKKYVSLGQLNEAWYRRFTSWEQVEPNRLSTILSYTDFIDWRTFIQAKLGEDLRMRYETVKRAAPDRVATSHAASPSLFTSPLAGDGSPDDWIMAKQVDYYGTSFYPKHSMPVGRDPAWRGALLDFAKSSNPRGFYVGELQSGFGTVALNVSATVTPADLRVWMWSTLARGAKSVNVYAYYPMSTGYEAGGYGLIHLDGTITERAKVAGSVARAVDRNASLFAQARAYPAEVAIVNNPLSYFIGGRQRVATVIGPQSEVATIERDSQLGVYRALFPTSVPVDFFHINELSDLARYKLVVLPYPLMLPGAAAKRLAEYVRGGGALVTEARPGWTDERARAAEIIPGLGLHEVFGCRETAVQSVPGNRTELIWESDALLMKGDRLPGRLYEETLEPLSARARTVARFANGASAAVMATYGKGKTLALGSYLAYAYEAQRDPLVQKLFTSLLDWAGVARPVEVRNAPPGEVEVRLLRSGADTILLAFNHGERDAMPEVVVRFPAARVSDIVTGAAAPVTGGVIRRALPAGDVWVLRVQP